MNDTKGARLSLDECTTIFVVALDVLNDGENYEKNDGEFVKKI